MDIGQDVIDSILDAFLANRKLAERAIEQVSDEKLKSSLDPNINSISVIMKHIAGNLISRWTDFLTTDGEKADRNRDVEFVDDFDSRADLMTHWDRGWTCLMDTLGDLKPEDLAKTVTIRGVAHSVPKAMARSLAHTSYHIGQIVEQARVHAGENWETLTIPRGQSEAFNRENWGEAGKSHS